MFTQNPETDRLLLCTPALDSSFLFDLYTPVSHRAVRSLCDTDGCIHLIDREGRGSDFLI